MKTLAFLTLALVPALVHADEPKAIRVPFQMLSSQHMTVMATVNGKGPFRFVFDTGAPFTLINNKVGKDAGIFPPNFKPSIFTLLTNQVQFTIDTIDIGGLKLDKVDCMAFDHPTVNAIAKYEDTELYGIIGFNVFGRYRTTIDYKTKTMEFVPSGFQPPNMIEKMSKMMSGGETMMTRVLAPGGLLGVRLSKEAGDKQAGVTVADVFAGSPAEKAGLKAGDRLLTLDDRWTDSIADCFEAAAYVKLGTPAQLEIERAGKKMTLRAVFVQGQ